MKRIIILHEFGAKSHFRALDYLLENNYPNVRLEHYEFKLFRFFIKSLVKKDFRLLKKQFSNMFLLFSLALSSNNLIIIGIAPFDFRLIFLRYLLKKHNVFYFTSWPHWDKIFYPKKPLLLKKYIFKKWRKFLENEIKGIFCVTEKVKENLNLNYNITSPIIEIYHSHGHRINKNLSERLVNDKKYVLKCLYVGRLIEEKGINELIELMNQLSAKRFHFTFVGSGPLESRLKEETAKKSNIEILGFIKNSQALSSIYYDHDLLLLPSKKTFIWEELFGMAIIEAMAHGLIPISTKHIGPSEIIKDNINGYLVDESNISGEINKILLNLANDLNKIATLKQEVLRSAEQYTNEELAKRWCLILSDYLDKIE